MLVKTKIRLKKEDILLSLHNRTSDKLKNIAQTKTSILRMLFSFTYHPDQLIRWRAIEALGIIAPSLFQTDGDKVREFIRSLFWLMNDESGGLGWYAPEVIAEIIFHIPQLQKEYAKLLPQYLTEEPFERGTHWALVRLVNSQKDLITTKTEVLIESLSNPDCCIRGYASKVLGMVSSCITIDSKTLSLLGNDNHKCPWYEFTSGVLTDMTVSQLARDLLEITNHGLHHTI